MLLFRSFGVKNLKAFLNIGINGEEIGRLVFELRFDIVPKTSLNFLSLCLGGKGKTKSGKDKYYKNSSIHRIVPGQLIHGGDYVFGNGTGGESIYGHHFNDENFKLTHDEAGVLSMANSGPNTNGSQFLLTSVPCPWLDGKNVVFGKLVAGWEVLSSVQSHGSENGAPKVRVEILDCGEIEDK